MTQLKRLAPVGCPSLDLSPAACHGRRHDFIEACLLARHGFVWRSPEHQCQPVDEETRIDDRSRRGHHKDQHHAVALDRLGQLLAEIVITTDLAGYTQFASWISDFGGQVLVGIEGAGSYGAGLCEYLQGEGIEVFEVERPRRRERRTGKSDRLDALLAAKKVLAGDGLSTPRGAGKRAALQMLLVAHRSLVSERSRLYNTMQALQISAPNALRERIGQVKGGAKLAERLTGMRTRPTASLQENTTLEVLRDMANRARALDTQAKTYALEIETLARSLAPKLLEEPGVGPICAGKLLAFNPARFTSEHYPNNMTANYIYNKVGNPINLEYKKNAYCATTCPEVWFNDKVVPSIHGQWIEQPARFPTSSIATTRPAD
jgi:transposase